MAKGGALILDHNYVFLHQLLKNALGVTLKVNLEKKYFF